MNQLAKQTAGGGLIDKLAAQYEINADQFKNTVLKTCFPNAKATNEELAAFLMVANQYKLNPLLKELYAFPSNGGIQTIVPIDGWINLINSNPNYNGCEFEDHTGENGKLSAITCRMYRKDRDHPICVTEYMAECVRNTSTWKQWPIRMLRHKAMIQAARYAFGFAGIVEPDEAERIKDVNPAPVKSREARQAVEKNESETVVLCPDDLRDRLEICASEGLESLKAEWQKLSTTERANARFEFDNLVKFARSVDEKREADQVNVQYDLGSVDEALDLFGGDHD